MTKLDSILKRRGITLLTKVHIVKATIFPVVMYGCESWTIKKLSTQECEYESSKHQLWNCGAGEEDS